MGQDLGRCHKARTYDQPLLFGARCNLLAASPRRESVVCLAHTVATPQCTSRCERHKRIRSHTEKQPPERWCWAPCTHARRARSGHLLRNTRSTHTVWYGRHRGCRCGVGWWSENPKTYFITHLNFDTFPYLSTDFSHPARIRCVCQTRST